MTSSKVSQTIFPLFFADVSKGCPNVLLWIPKMVRTWVSKATLAKNLDTRGADDAIIFLLMWKTRWRKRCICYWCHACWTSYSSSFSILVFIRQCDSDERRFIHPSPFPPMGIELHATFSTIFVFSLSCKWWRSGILSGESLFEEKKQIHKKWIKWEISHRQPDN